MTRPPIGPIAFRAAAVVVVAALGGLQSTYAHACRINRSIPSRLPLEQRPSYAKPNGIAFVGRVHALEKTDVVSGQGFYMMHVSVVRAIKGEPRPETVIHIGLCDGPSAKIGDEVLMTGVYSGEYFLAD